jgi:dethiobiotin synthase
MMTTRHVPFQKPTTHRIRQQATYVRDLLRELVLRDLKIRYKRSYLGILWSLVTPLTQVLIFSFLFIRVLPLDIPNYTAFLFVGVLAWSWFATALNSSTGSVANNAGLVRRPGFPVAVLPVLSVATSARLPAGGGARGRLPAARHLQRRSPRGGLGARDEGARCGRGGTPVSALPGRLRVVTGTDTGVGKTIATAALAARAGAGALVVKPSQTGVGAAGGTTYDDVPDVDTVTRLTGVPGRELGRLAEPLAPDSAARRAGVAIPTVAEHAAEIRSLLDAHETVVVEGSGGLLVRLDTEGGTLLDLVVALADLDPEVVVVTRSGLGTLNHTELTVGALRAAGVAPAGLVLGSWPDSPGLAESCNREDLPRVTGLPVLAVLPEGAGTLSRAAFLAAAPTWFR